MNTKLVHFQAMLLCSLAICSCTFTVSAQTYYPLTNGVWKTLGGLTATNVSATNSYAGINYAYINTPTNQGILLVDVANVAGSWENTEESSASLQGFALELFGFTNFNQPTSAYYNGQFTCGNNLTNISVISVRGPHAGTYYFDFGLTANEVASGDVWFVDVSTWQIRATYYVTPAITNQPKSQTGVIGKPVIFSVGTVGTSNTFQWYKSASAISGATYANYTNLSVAASAAGDYYVVVRNPVTSVTSETAVLTVVSAPSITTQPASLAIDSGSPAAFTVTATGTAPLSYQWQKGGINLTNGAALSGVTASTLNFTTTTANDDGVYQAIVTNNYGSVTSVIALLTITIVGPLQVTVTSLPSATNGFFYSTSLQASGGTPPYAWSLSPGSSNPPPRLSLSTSGLLSGTPSSPGLFSLQARVTDVNSAMADSPLLPLAVVNPPALHITTVSPLPTATNGTTYGQTLQVSGGIPPYSWFVPGYSAAPPPNLRLSTNGLLSGALAIIGTIPFAGTNYYFDVAVTDAAANQAELDGIELTVVNLPSAPLLITNLSLPSGTIGAAYTVRLGATGGQPPYKWSLTLGSASLPDGLALDPTGLISGVPTAIGSQEFKLQVEDTNLLTASLVLSIVVNQSPPPLAMLPAGTNVVLTWPTNFVGFTLQSSTNLIPPVAWGNASIVPVVNQGQNAVTMPLSSVLQFFRLNQSQ